MTMRSRRRYLPTGRQRGSLALRAKRAQVRAPMSAWRKIAPSVVGDPARQCESAARVPLYVHRFENRSCRSSKTDSAQTQWFRKAPEGGEGKMFSSVPTE